MRLNQSVLADAIKNGETGTSLWRRARRMKSRFVKALREGFWFCNNCQASTEREEGEQGQPAHCQRCGSPRIEWCAPVIAEDRQYIEPEDLHEEL